MVVHMAEEVVAWRRNGRVGPLVSVVPQRVPKSYKTGRRAQLTRYAVGPRNSDVGSPTGYVSRRGRSVAGGEVA